MKSKAKNIDIDDLIINAKNKARELMEKNLKPQRKEKSGNQTSRNSKSKKQGLLIGGAYVKLSIEVKDKLRDELGKIAPLVLLLKHTIVGKMIGSFEKKQALDEGKINDWIRDFNIILANLAKTKDSEGNENDIYGYDVFERRMIDGEDGEELGEELAIFVTIDYKEYGIKKEIETLNSFKILYNLLNIKDEDDPDQGVLYYGGAFVKKNAEEIAALKDEEEQKMLKFNEDTKRADFEFKYEPLGEDFKNMPIEQKRAHILERQEEGKEFKKNLYTKFRRANILPVNKSNKSPPNVPKVEEEEEEGEEEKEKDAKGGAPTKYKSTGQVVYIVYKNKKYKRTIYTKEKGKTKYCKMNNEYILLSKCKIIV